MPPETEVISCPACKHLVRVPADWLGTQVQCPECRAMFKAPVRDGDKLTEPELLSAPAAVVALRKKPDAMLMLPAFGLMLVGVISLIVNTVTLVQLAQDPQGFETEKREQAVALARQLGRDPADLGGLENLKWEWFAIGSGWGDFCGLVSFLGGLGIVLRRWRLMALAGCVTAALNLSGFCCVPGGVFAVWGLLMMLSAEGRAHFR